MKESLALRKVSKRLSYRKRYLSLSSIEQVRLKRLKKLILVVLRKIKICDDHKMKEEMNFKVRKLIMIYFSIVTAKDEGLVWSDDSIISASDCKIMFEFKKTDLLRLLPLLRLPDECTFDNRSKMAGEEVLYLEQTSMKLREYLDEIGRLNQGLLNTSSNICTYFIEQNVSKCAYTFLPVTQNCVLCIV